MAVEAKLKRWGNSMAVVVPAEVVEERNLKENESVVIEVMKKADISRAFGLIKKKDRKMTGQQMKDMVRKGWA